MPEPPDFDQLARTLIRVFDYEWTLPPEALTDGDTIEKVAHELRQVWNARGAADEDAVVEELGGPTPECLRAAGAIRIVDR